MKNIDPSDINIINYLSGEMSTEELKQFEKQLNENELLKSQVEEMKMVQGQLRNWNNDAIAVPDIEESLHAHIPPKQQIRKGGQSGSKQIRFSIPNWAKYAAAFLGFVVLLQITGLKINQEGNALMLSFGEPDIERIDASDVNLIVAKALENYDQKQNSELANFRHQVNVDMGQLNSTVLGISKANETNMSQLKSFLDRNLDQQYASMQSILEENESNQRQEMEDSFTGLVEYLDNNRIKDQLNIQNAFSDIATAINNQQYQTNALLTSISSAEDTSLKSY